MASFQYHTLQAEGLEDNCVAVLVHGGGGIAFGPSTSLYKLISTLLKPKTIVSVELPCHGKNRSSHVPEPQDALEHACSELAPKTRGKKVVFVAYSAGAMFSMKIWSRLFESWDPKSFAAFVGASFTAGKNCDGVQWYWSPETMESLGKAEMLKALHGEEWKSTALLVKKWCTRTSSNWLTEEERKRIIAAGRVYWVCGSVDQPYPPNEILDYIDDKMALSRCIIVPCDHFNYFSTGWEYTSAALRLVCGREAGLAPTMQIKPKL